MSSSQASASQAGSTGREAARRAAEAISGRLQVGEPVCAIVLGSGLGGLASRIGNARTVSFQDIPGFPAATVAGHRGTLTAGTLDGREVLTLAGRLHLYEGHSPELAAYPVRLLHALGARTLFVSNAAGGIRRTFRAGDLMIIADHLNLQFRNPLIGKGEKGEPRFPDMSNCYDSELRALLARCAAEAGVPVREGVYAAVLGPAYETPAEIRMLERFGADAVGMSTVPEVIAARALGMRVAGMSCITNLAAGISPVRLSHEEVLETSAAAAEAFEKVVRGFVAAL